MLIAALCPPPTTCTDFFFFFFFFFSPAILDFTDVKNVTVGREGEGREGKEAPWVGFLQKSSENENYFLLNPIITSQWGAPIKKWG